MAINVSIVTMFATTIAWLSGMAALERPVHRSQPIAAAAATRFAGQRTRSTPGHFVGSAAAASNAPGTRIT
jgi:hypothetical protein